MQLETEKATMSDRDDRRDRFMSLWKGETESETRDYRRDSTGLGSDMEGNPINTKADTSTVLHWKTYLNREGLISYSTLNIISLNY